MVICNIQCICLKSFVDNTLQFIGQPENSKASDEGKAFPCISTFSSAKKERSTLENTIYINQKFSLI